MFRPPASKRKSAASVLPAVETDPTDRRGDSADDSVVIASETSGEAWILGTDKQGGLRVFSLDGLQHAFLELGKLNNVDAVPRGTNRFLVAASNRTALSIDLFDVRLGPLKVERVSQVALDFEDPYGLCMAQIDNEPHVFVGDKQGQVQRWRIMDDYSAELIESWSFESLTEGCVVDREDLVLYVGEEEAGIWAIDLGGDGRSRLARVGDGYLEADVEGLDIHYSPNGKRLIASSQGDDSFVVYQLPGGQPLLKFRIGEAPGRGIDGVSETDGVSVYTGALQGFPAGILVVQDGRNVLPAANQNFKIVDLGELEPLLNTDQ
jgi:3-phytase